MVAVLQAAVEEVQVLQMRTEIAYVLQVHVILDRYVLAELV
jgi:hypothetical protein